jgi:pimeloyl-ACP methyl ester carboxylesterase
MPFRQVNGLRMHYQQAGEGPDVILVHGVTGDLSIWFLCKAIQTLSTRYRVTAYDLRGHGYTDAPPDGYLSCDHAADMFGLMDELGIARATVVGHSFGGVIAMHAAVLASERIEALVFSDPYFPALRHLEDASRWGHWQTFRAEASAAGVELSDEHWYDIGRFFDQIMHFNEEQLLKFRHAVGLPTMQRMLRLGKTTCGDDSRSVGGLTADLIEGVSQPALALFGEFSPFLATAKYLSEHLPRCGTAIVPGAKHRAPEESPEQYLRLLTEFLDSVHESGAVCSTHPTHAGPA